MTIRIAFLVAALFVSASGVSAQGQPQKQVVISKAVLKSMIANKPKSKKPLGARIGIVRRASAVPSRPDKAPPTSVREIKLISK